jgi:hypothetical protein
MYYNILYFKELESGGGTACLWMGITWIEYSQFCWRTWNTNALVFGKGVKSSHNGCNLTN